MIWKIVKIFLLVFLFFAVAGASLYITATLIIKSEDKIIVPELVGKDVVYALQTLSDLGVNTKVKGAEYNSRIPKNHIIFQSPSPGSEIKKGRDIKIVISKGAETILMPNLIGLSLQQAHIILEENDLKRGYLSKTHTNETRKGEIAAQSPQTGSAVSRETSVDLLVSLGGRPRAMKMPDLNGMTVEEAVAVIENIGLIPGKRTFRPDDAKSKNTVIAQNPLFGYRAIAGTAVDLVINRKPGNGSGTGEKTDDVFFRYRTGPGFLKTHVRVSHDAFGIQSDLFEEFAKPNEDIWLLVPSGASVSLYVDDELMKTQYFGSE